MTFFLCCQGPLALRIKKSGDDEAPRNDEKKRNFFRLKEEMMMKKFLSLLVALALALGLTGLCLAESEDARPAPSPDPYSGIWQCDRATAEIIWEEEGYRVLIQWGSSAWELTEWEYSCYYQEADNTMVATDGSRVELTFNDAGEETNCRVVYEDGKAVFSLDAEGRLIWQDGNENAGEGLRFVRTGDYPEAAEELSVG